jgi:hypothetical protein
MANGTIKEIISINIMHYDSGDVVYIKHPDLKEMVEADALNDLRRMLDMMFMEKNNPSIKEALDRARVLYELSKT